MIKSKTHILLIILVLFLGQFSFSQVSFKIDEDLYGADLTVKIGDDVYSPDIRIELSSDVYSPDFSVGITNDKRKAQFIISKSSYADYKIKAGEDTYSPDVRIKASDDVYSPDLKIELKKTGSVDYLVYTEKDFMTLSDMVIALLPAINYHLDYENDELKEFFQQD